MSPKNIKIWTTITLVIAGIFVWYGIAHFSGWQRSEQLFPVINKEIISWWNIQIPSSREKTIQTSNAYLLLKAGKYAEALPLITGTDSQSLYNRGIIETLLAYDKASQADTSGLQEATTSIENAKSDFLYAKELSSDPSFLSYIAENAQTVEELSIVITAKTCYTLSTAIIQNLSWFQSTIDTIRQALTTERQAIEKTQSSTPSDCVQQWQQTLATSNQNLQALQDDFTPQIQTRQQDLMQKRVNPSLCLNQQDFSVIDNINETQQMLTNFAQQHEQSLAIRKSQDKKSIQELCQQTKNDSQIDESIQNTIEKLLASLQNSTVVPASSGAVGTSSTPKYLPLNANDQKLLETIDKKNKIWIRQIQRLKTDPQYNGFDYVQTLFKEFYGNTGDFSN